MSINFKRSTSFLSVNAGQSLDELLETTRGQRAKYVVVNVNRGRGSSFYLAEHKNFVTALEQLKKKMQELEAASKAPSEVTLQDVLQKPLDDSQEVETTADPLARLSARTRSMIDDGNVVIHFQRDRPASILLPPKIRFDKMSSRGWLDLNHLSSLGYLEIADYMIPKESAEKAEEIEEELPAGQTEWAADLDEEEETATEHVEAKEPASSHGPTAKPPESTAPPEKVPARPWPQNTKANGGSRPPGDGETGGDGGDSGGEGGPPSGDIPAYPDISVSEEHPVQSTTIDVEVRIKFEKPAHTVGTIHLPSDNKLYTLDVHLLLGKESLWKQLTFQRPNGTIDSAVFKNVKVPSLPEADRYSDKRLPCDIYVNFYLLTPYQAADATPVRSARWCGEAVRRIEVLPRAGMAPTPIEPPEELEWRKYLHVSPTSPPPDLLVRIKKLTDKEYQWTVLSPHRDFTGLPADQLLVELSVAPYTFMQDHFEQFAGKPLDDEQIQKLHEACNLIYAAVPPGFRTAYWDLRLGTGQDPEKRAALDTIQFISDEPYIPWELMRVADDNRAPDEDPEILALRHAVGRWIAPDSLELRQSLRVTEIAVFATDYALVAKVKTKLKWALDELKNLVTNFKAVEYKVLKTVVGEFLIKGRAQVVHFSCHGRMNVQIPDQAVIELEDADLFAATVWSTESRRGIGRQRPLVFLNACQTGAAGELLGFVFGWPQAFLRMGATACVAPLWSVIDESAKDVAAEFYDLVLKSNHDPNATPTTLGEALRVIRSRWKDKKSLTYLGYVLYGDPTATLDWQQGK